MGRILCLDMGSKFIGIAISDEMKSIAQGLPTIRRDTEFKWLDEIGVIIQERDVEKIIMGYPVDMSGVRGKSAREIEELGDKLRQKMGREIVLWDERLSTVEAERVLIQAEIKRKKRRKIIDKVAAVIILQNYLDSVRYRSRI